MVRRIWFDGSPFRGLTVLAGFQAVLYGAIASQSAAFIYGKDPDNRPILLLLGLFTTCFLLYLAAIRVAVRSPPARNLGWSILLSSLLFRALLLFTPPILEIDVYRYLWEGAATSQGVNPYRYAPAQVLAVNVQQSLPADLRKLATMRDDSPELAEILRRIHFGELPTVYPLVSQLVFALSDWLTPRAASVATRVALLKGLLLAFDIGTIALLWKLLLITRRHPGWTICYAWCPLVLKEFANTGHLDVIAVFFTTSAIYLAVTLRNNVQSSRFRIATCGVMLGAAIGAKLYPVVLLPLFVIAIIRWRGVVAAGSLALVACAVGAATVAPMLLTEPYILSSKTTDDRTADSLSPNGGSPSFAEGRPRYAEPSSGLKAFLSRWEINDFVFMLVVENVRPRNRESVAPWFAVVPESWRSAWSTYTSQLLATDARTAGFLLARALTLCAFGAITANLAARLFRHSETELFLEAAFFTLAWFWLLAPTQNPWYWTWAIPLLPFVRGRAWYVLSALAMTYYLRFWLGDRFPSGPTLGTRYDGKQFFDYVVWLEFAPRFAWLAWEWARSHAALASTEVRE